MSDQRTHDTQLENLSAELRRSAVLAGSTPLELAIPSCPGWSAEDLWHHLGSTHRWATELVVSARTERIRKSDLDIELPEADQLPRWIAVGGEALVTALGDAGDTPVWSWVGTVPASWWTRRQLHETLVHNLDAVIALGAAVEVEPDLAEDCLDEYLEMNAHVSQLRPGVPDDSYTVHLHATDRDDSESGEWMICVENGTLNFSKEHGKGDMAVRAPVVDLLLLTTGRRDLGHISAEVFGDTQTLDKLTGLVAL